jgi:hypothetical protein
MESTLAEMTLSEVSPADLEKDPIPPPRIRPDIPTPMQVPADERCKKA